MRLRPAHFESLAEAKRAAKRAAAIKDWRARGFEVHDDSHSGKLQLKDPAGGEATIITNGQSVTVISGEDRSTKYYFDTNGRLAHVIDSDGTYFKYHYDQCGRVVEIRRSDHDPYRFVFGIHGKLEKITWPDGSETHYTYNEEARLVCIKDRNGNKTSYAYSHDGLLALMIEPAGNLTRFEYDRFDKPLQVIFGNQDRLDLEYSDEGVLTRLLVNGQEHARFHIDAKEGAIKAQYADGTWTRRKLKDGRLTEANNDSGTVKLSYDKDGRLLKEESNEHVVKYLRDAIGRLFALVTPNGEKLIFRRNQENRVKRVIDWNGREHEIQYAPNGALARIQYPNGVCSIFTSTRMGLPSALTIDKVWCQPKLSCRWHYDSMDRLINEDHLGLKRKYHYNAEGQLLEVVTSESSFQERYELDANGNRLCDQGDKCQINGRNQLKIRGSEQFEYDSMGNQITGFCHGQPARFNFNARNQLIEASTCRGVARYIYDDLGRRICKEYDGVITRYVWAATKLLTEVRTYNGKDTRRDYLYLTGTPRPIAMRFNNQTYAIHTGRRCEPLFMTDQHGNLVWKATYTAFGEAWITACGIDQPLRLAGQYFDEETDLHYNITRFYDPHLGRFLSEDPLCADGGNLNLYGYCGGDPVNRIDTTMETEDDESGIGKNIAIDVETKDKETRAQPTVGKRPDQNSIMITDIDDATQ